MKRSLIYFLSLSVLPIVALAQFGTQQVITDAIEFPSKAIPLDIDGDSDIDILVAGNNDCELCWLENIDGIGSFGNPIIIDIDPITFIDIQHVDVDGDGDKDIMYIENNPRTLKWLENEDGAGSFSNAQLILEQDFIRQFIFEDIDLDGDNDLLLSFTDTFNDWISWLENEDGQGNFGNEQLLIDDLDFLSNILYVDVDNDGLKDILTADEENGPAQILYYKNTGNETFDAGNPIFQFQFIQSDFTSVFGIQYVDLNNNGFKDIVFRTNNDDVGQFTNIIPGIDGNGMFGESSILLQGQLVTLISDLDNDDDNDLLTNFFNGNTLLYYEFQENLDLSNPAIATNEVENIRDFHVADIDNDGFLDLITASIGDNKVAWYPNQTLGINDNILTNISVFPNPVSHILTIESVLPIDTVSAVNILGQHFNMEVINNQVDFSHLNTGVYFLEIIDIQSQATQVIKLLKL